MDVIMPVSIAICIVLVTMVTTWAFRVVRWGWLRPKKLEKCLRELGFNGNPYRFLFGDIRDLSTMMKEESEKVELIPHALPYYQHIIKKYGNNSFIWVGPYPRLNITDPELIKEILSKPNIFLKPHPAPLRDIVLGTGGLFVTEDEIWAKHRKIINPAFHLEKLKNMLPAIYSSCSAMVNKWEMLVQEGGSAEVDAYDYLGDLSGDVISRSAFGGEHGDGEKIFQLQKEQITLSHQLARFSFIPGWRFLPIQENKRFHQVCRELEGLLRNIINKKENAMNMKEVNNHDLLGILLESNSKEINESGCGLSMAEVMDECKVFYLAGAHTTANLLVRTMVLLSIHPNWQKQAREEVLKVFGNRKPDFDGLNNLKIITLILHEVLRLYPPSVMIYRAISKEAHLGTMTLPAGVQFAMQIMLVHRDPEIWGEDAAEFKPERFSEGVNAIKGNHAFFPFGGGPRRCIGQNFALIEAKTALAMILQRFDFELSPSYKESLLSLAILPHQLGAKIVIHRI